MKTTGIPEYRHAMKVAGNTIGRRAATVTRKTGADITRDAKILAPYELGTLENSIGMEVTGDGRSGHMSVSIGPTVLYGKYQEEGTSKMAAQPYLRPATDRHLPAWQAALEAISTEGFQ